VLPVSKAVIDIKSLNHARFTVLIGQDRVRATVSVRIKSRSVQDHLAFGNHALSGFCLCILPMAKSHADALSIFLTIHVDAKPDKHVAFQIISVTLKLSRQNQPGTVRAFSSELYLKEIIRTVSKFAFQRYEPQFAALSSSRI